MVEAYRCVRELGRGMAGVVHEAVTPDGRRVVLKALRPHLIHHPGLLERFRREALMMAEIRHPNVMPVLDVQAEARPPFYVMPWVEGRPLAALLAEGGPHLPIGRVLEVLRGVASALVEIHRQGLVHRDLKPENVLLVSGGGVVVFDFGLAKRTTTEGGADLTKEGQILGTPAYMAPEQLRSAGVDGRTDVYALGVLAAELLTGTNPFAHEDVVETCRRQLVLRPERLDQLLPSRVGRALGLLVAGMLSKQRAERPTAREVLAAVDRELAMLTRARGCATQPSARVAAAPAPQPPSAAHKKPVVAGPSAAHTKPVAVAGPSAAHRKPVGGPPRPVVAPRTATVATATQVRPPQARTVATATQTRPPLGAACRKPSRVDVAGAQERARAQLSA